ncbi:hypothetical protein RI367_006440 [Sorochytrium milnesiophthora]
MQSLNGLPLELVDEVILHLPLQDVCSLSQVNRRLRANLDPTQIAERRLSTLKKALFGAKPSAQTVRQLKQVTEAVRTERYLDRKLKHKPAKPHRHLPAVPLKVLRRLCHARYRSNNDTASFCLRIPLPDATPPHLETTLHYKAARQGSERYGGAASSATMTMDVSPALIDMLSLPKDAKSILLWWRSRNFVGEYQLSENVKALQMLADLFSRARVGGVTDWTAPRVRDMLATLTHTVWYNDEDPNAEETRWTTQDEAFKHTRVPLWRTTEDLWAHNNYETHFNTFDIDWAAKQYVWTERHCQGSTKATDPISVLLSSMTDIPAMLQPKILAAAPVAAAPVVTAPVVTASVAAASSSFGMPSTGVFTFSCTVPSGTAVGHMPTAPLAVFKDTVFGTTKSSFGDAYDPPSRRKHPQLRPKSPSLLDTCLQLVDEARIAYLTSPSPIFEQAQPQASLDDASKADLERLITGLVSTKSEYSDQQYPLVDQDVGYGTSEFDFRGQCQLKSSATGVVATLDITYWCTEAWEQDDSRVRVFTCTLPDAPSVKHNMRNAQVQTTVAEKLGMGSVPANDFIAVMFACAIGPNVPFKWAWKKFHFVEDQ